MSIDQRYGFNTNYVACPVNDTTFLAKTGSSGAKGDILERLVITALTGTDNAVNIVDGAVSIDILPDGVSAGVYEVEIGAASYNGAWSVATGLNVSVLAVGKFS